VFDCQQSDADAFCKLKTGSPTSTAISFQIQPTLPAPGICCSSEVVPGCVPLGNFADRGVPLVVSVDDHNLLASHHGGEVVTNVVCTP
jgi:hypothetical protein